MDVDKVSKRMEELGRPIDEAILLCDNRDDLLMLASLMAITLRNIYDLNIGENGRKQMFTEFAK
tara:strand:+ start:413 stop:604 length:192 start_codon:yes stop_codon:yes gene_type:complete